MKKYQALTTITKKLAEEGNIYCITSRDTKDFLKSKSKHFQPITIEKKVDEIEERGYMHLSGYENELEFEIYPAFPDSEDVEHLKMSDQKKSIIKINKDYPFQQAISKMKDYGTQLLTSLVCKDAETVSANYLFISDLTRAKDGWEINLYISCFPYALIGEKEIDHLRHMYLGYPDEEIEEAAKELEIYEDIKFDFNEVNKDNYQRVTDSFLKLPEENQVKLIQENWDTIKDGKFFEQFRKHLAQDKKDVLAKASRHKLVGEVQQ